MPVIAEQTRVANIYNPQNQTKEQLIEGFVARENTFQKLLKVIKEAKMDVPEQHYLVLGRRGMGKTTLLMRLYYAIEDDKELDWLIPLVFNEEEYGIRRLFGFWERILELLEDKIPNFGGNETVRKALSRKFSDDDAYERALFDLLTEELKRTEKKIILFVDNFGDLTRKFSDAEGHRFRKILQSSSDIRIIASSSVVIDDFYKYDHPFYEFFKVVELQGLNEKETRHLLLSLSRHYKNESVAKIIENHPGRVEALRRIAGGVIRTMVLLFEIFADDDDGSAFNDLEKVLDRSTPLYKHKMDDLSDQQQAIVEAISLNWDALSVKEIVERTRLDSKTISAQLHNLEKNGIIERRATTTKNHVYLVAERFFNIWFLMRLGRRGDEKRVLWLVRFFEEWCDNEMMKSRATLHMDAILKGGFAPKSAFSYTQALAQTPKLNIADRHELLQTTRNYLLKTNPELAKDLMESELNIIFDALQSWFTRKKEEGIQRISSCCAGILDSDKIEIFNKLKNPIEIHNFWSSEIPNIAFQVGNIYESLKNSDNVKAIHCWIWSAKKGNERAMYNLGWIFQNKLNDIESSINWYVKAANLGDIDAMCNLGLIFKKEKYDIEKSIDWFEKAAFNGNSDAMYFLGTIFEEINISKAIEWYEKAAEAGDSDAMENIGFLYHFEVQDLTKAISWYEKAATLGSSDAMESLGWIFQNEKGDLSKAIEWYGKAAALGNSDAMEELGWIIKKESGDFSEAKKWFEKAANLGNSSAMNALGRLFEKDKNDIENAIEWYNRAAALENSDSMYNLGCIFRNSAKDNEQAIDWFKKSSALNNSDSMNMLGWIYLNEKKEIEKSIRWYENAAELGNSNAMLNLGYINYTLNNNTEKGIEWYNLAAKNGNSKAMYSLGRIADVFEKDFPKAIEWLNKAAEAGESDAMNSLSWLLFSQKNNKEKALFWIEKSLETKPINDYKRHTASCIYAWHNDIKLSYISANEFLKNEELLDKEADAIITFFILMMAKRESTWLLEQFNSPVGESVHLKDRFKPIYYAILKDLDHPDFLRIGDELRQTVDEILARAKQMAIDYA